MRPVAGPRFLFDAYLLSYNAPTFDYIVYLVDANGDRTGPFFFVQVKTTSRTPVVGMGYSVKFSLDDVKRAQATKVPFFLCIVDRAVKGDEKFYIKGVDSRLSSGIFRLFPEYDLTADAVKLELYREVERVWGTQIIPVLAKFL
jgi:hypothetical protein